MKNIYSSIILMTLLLTTSCGEDNKNSKEALSDYSRIQLAIHQNESAEEWSHMKLYKYDCTIPTMLDNDNQCLLEFINDNEKHIHLNANAEVAANWALGKEMPTSELTIHVYKSKEVIRIFDSEGEELSRKMDFSR